MDTPGNLLRSERKKQQKSLKDIEDILKISIEYLRAIEKDNYELLPADLFTKSYLRSYAKTLGLESDRIMDLYNKQFGTPTANEPEPRKKQWNILLRPTTYISLLAICIGLVIIALTSYIKYDVKLPPLTALDKAVPDVAIEKNEIAMPPEVKTEAAMPPEEKIEVAMPLEVKTEAAVPPAEEAVGDEVHSLKILATNLTWVSIKIDNADAEELLLRAGESTALTAHEKFFLKIGNAGGTSLILNGEDIGKLGPLGQAIDITLP